jgi:hypothetical protein
LALIVGSIPPFHCVPIQDAMPIAAVTRIKEAGVAGKMVVHFDWGEYCLWHLGPAVQVSMDGRRETVYSDAVYTANMNFTDGVGDDWDAVLRDASVTMVLADRKFPAFNLMRLAPGWSMVYQDKVAGLFARQGSDAVKRLTAPGLPVAAEKTSFCFP